jgi:hypothetical protein
MIQTIDSLQKRSLLEVTQSQRYTLQNVVMEFMTEVTIRALANEINNDNRSTSLLPRQSLFFFNSLAIYPGSSPTYVRSSTVIDADKDNWISKYGSDLLKEMLKSGDKSNTQYAIERLEIDYPGFKIIEERGIEQVDTPPSYCLEACRAIEGSYCGQYRYSSSTYYLTIDKYLGSYQIAKEIVSPNREIKQKIEIEKLFEPDELFEPEESISEEKETWIFLNGLIVMLNVIMESNYPQPSIDPISISVKKIPVFPKLEG